MNNLLKSIPSPLKENLYLKAFGMTQVPALGYVSPKVMEIDSKRCVVRIPLNRRTKNHLKAMYFGVLCVGADCAGGLIAMSQIAESGKKVALVFKDMKCEFLKRAEGDVFFTCEDGESVRAGLDRAVQSGERQNIPVKIVATAPSKLGSEPVATFEMTLSLKKKA